MDGLTTVQRWRLEHIVRCSCGSWLMVTDRELKGHARVVCPHINPDVLEETA